ncbi:VCBS repeat-containing protein [Croceivirga thetidis]|uniref:VCBS repeat-containing protein n=1 Tax=Croceivirga thetidis TaxID=2721623 RepID=A0ABX1GVP1_9FLAO|nr:VCBS repeat-containing protein [Croceivirga thetidis]NKI33055.1 VCBS repeat-containing protein [Croceivirga thetidis]
MMRSIVLVLVFIVLLSCSGEKDSRQLFQLVEVAKSNVEFENTIKTDDTINVIDFQYCYNGGGVGIGDFNLDGLPDLVFSGNQVGARLYLNQGDLQFVDITESSGLISDSWLTGVSIVDVNADGLADIYLNVGGADCQNDCDNLLFINQGKNKNGIPFFEEMAGKYGLADANYSQQTVFFDYDLDGDLDAYVLRNGNFKFDKNSPIPKKYFPEHLTDALFENVKVDSLDHPLFIDVSEKMGITHKGFGLGVGINDFDNNGLIDVYVANDFISNDLLYMNFTKPVDSIGFIDQSQDYFQHQTYNAMGVDIADLNNDNRPDVFVLDMLPQDYYRQKTMLGSMNYDKYNLALRNSYSPQYMRNTLHINSGFINEEPVRFSEVSFFSEVGKTDWSWAPLLADFDMDGDNDIFITNGYGKDITNLDFINYTQQSNIFGTREAKDVRLKGFIDELPPVSMNNFLFENTSELKFQDRTKQWLPDIKTLSNGAAYSDLDLDGDLDLIINNINQKALILKNTASEDEDFRYIKVKLKGERKNPSAIGAKISIWEGSLERTHFQSVVRGYLSSVEDGAFFGINAPIADSLRVVWPNGKVTKMNRVSSNQTLYLDIDDAKIQSIEKGNFSKLFTTVTPTIEFTHNEEYSNEYAFQHLLMTQHSMNSPILKRSPLNDLESEFVFVGNSTAKPSQIWKSNKGNVHEFVQEITLPFEVTDALFFDFDNDNDLDLYLASGGNVQPAGSEIYQDRLYLNDGAGYFEYGKTVLPISPSSTSCVKSSDFDKDGDMDLFVGSNIVPHSYPSKPKNYLLENINGKLSIKTTGFFEELGMVKDAAWQDIDGDGWDDLIVVGDWMPIQIFKNRDGNLEPLETKFFNGNDVEVNTSGWYNTIASGDFDNDGDIDFLLGNQGNNNFINPSEEYPAYLYTKDFDNNGSVDPLIGMYYDTEAGKKLMPLHSRDDVMKQLPALKNRLNSYQDFAEVDFVSLLEIKNLSEETFKVSNSQSIYLENKGNAAFSINPLPYLTQLGPISCVLVDDFDEDGNLDALLAGNDFYAESVFGRYDAVTGIYLKGNGKGNFRAISASESGFYLPEHTTSLIQITGQESEKLILAAQRNNSLKAFSIQPNP